MSTLGLLPDISRTTGPMLITYLLQWGLFGVLSVQVYNYYLAFSKDPRTAKILVYAVYVAELVQTILVSQMAFKEFAAGFGNFEALDKVGNIWFAIPVLSSTVEFAVQIFYANKIKLLAKSNFIAAVVVLVALIQLGGGIGAGVLAHKFPHFSQAVMPIMLVFYPIWFAGSAVCDVIIAVSMTYYLSHSKTTWKATQRIVQRLIFLFIGSGALTAAIAIITFVLFMLPGHPAYYGTTSGILGKMYSNTMMVILNNRIVLQAQDETVMLDEHVSPSTSMFNRGISQRPAFRNSHSSTL